ncbi:MAG TPA: 4Fe-4S dicluster domain-containing protein [Methanospirillum sp.]|uniref:4Fe-4S dicluster domain-containing protein n=1 Tax=Methanospirillum sp. TaxID=45200 RepID=UPI002C0A943A|nr:4Fe-4S dicluster domain-containing protein [Methanospirillum sp.]HWQ63858.1 4Fe-4S dicluster domain-containing protein [Methanospirillum sp.]
MKTVFVRQDRCVGCRHCEIACAVEHSESKDLFQVFTEEKPSYPRIHVESVDNYLSFPNRCRHCDPAPCMQVCPTRALSRDEATGSVLVSYIRCIQCSVCAMACPFGIITFQQVRQLESDREVNAKCDNCIGRLSENRIPACAEACKTGALEFGDVNDLIKETRADLTMRLIRSQGSDIQVPAMPDNIRAFKAVMETIANL